MRGLFGGLEGSVGAEGREQICEQAEGRKRSESPEIPER